MTYSPEYLSDLMVRMAHHSTAIEGNTLTQGETKSVLIDGYVPRAMDMRELNEVLNYKVFMTFLIEQSTSSAPLSLSLIREVHTILFREAIESVPGQFKQRPNMIVGAGFTPTPPYLVPSALMDWIDNLAAQMDAAASDSDKVLAICRQHIRFERIHPFSDGNGRVGAVARQDVARSAVAVLRDPSPHAERTYDMTGPEALSLTDMARIIGEAQGREVTYREETVEEAYASRAHYGAPAWQVDAWVSTYTAIASGELDVVSDSVRALTGRSAMSMADLLGQG